VSFNLTFYHIPTIVGKTYGDGVSKFTKLLPPNLALSNYKIKIFEGFLKVYIMELEEIPMNQDYLLFFGNGGGRYNSVTQYLATGGFQIVIGEKFRIHVDPGPSTTAYLKQLGVSPDAINAILVTHSHLDHAHDVPVLAEGIRSGKKAPLSGVLATTPDTIASLSEHHRGFFKQIYQLSAGHQCTLSEDNGVVVQATRAEHKKDSQAIGFIVSANGWRVGITGDTVNFPEFTEVYSQVNVLVAYLRGPENYVSKSHLSLDTLAPSVAEIRKAGHLRAVILTHFGWRITNPGGPIRSQEQAIKLQNHADVPTHAAYLGFKFPL
jgi:ribonuclease BN (tRNA processing enzyme)